MHTRPISGTGVFYSSGHADVNWYVPAASVKFVFAGAYIMHEPDGDATRQLVAVPANMYPVGQDESDIVIYVSVMVIYPDGHDVDGAAPNASAMHIIAKIKNNLFIFINPTIVLKQKRIKYYGK